MQTFILDFLPSQQLFYSYLIVFRFCFLADPKIIAREGDVEEEDLVFSDLIYITLKTHVIQCKDHI